MRRKNGRVIIAPQVQRILRRRLSNTHPVRLFCSAQNPSNVLAPVLIFADSCRMSELPCSFVLLGAFLAPLEAPEVLWRPLGSFTVAPECDFYLFYLTLQASSAPFYFFFKLLRRPSRSFVMSYRRSLVARHSSPVTRRSPLVTSHSSRVTSH